MTAILQSINKLSKLDQEATESLLAKIESKTFEKGSYLLKSGFECRKIFFIEEGLVKTYFETEDKEFIMRFFPENSMFTVIDSYVQQTPSTYNILALETTTVTIIDRADMEMLCQEHQGIEVFFRKLLSFAAINMMKRISEMLEENATARYNHFLQENNPLLQRISLGDLSNYLGVTQVTLSRIRAKK